MENIPNWLSSISDHDLVEEQFDFVACISLYAECNWNVKQFRNLTNFLESIFQIWTPHQIPTQTKLVLK